MAARRLDLSGDLVGWRVGGLLPRLVRHRALGANLPRRSQRSKGGQRPNEDIIKADPGAGVPAISGGEPYSGMTFDMLATV
ncbi:MAG: hypothetical protein ACYCV7_01420 [Acidimicrobiales bacterium]